MTVGELIEELKKHDPNLPVMVRGYEAGVDDVNVLEKVKVILNAYEDWYFGDHEIVDSDEDQRHAVDALYLKT